MMRALLLELSDSHRLARWATSQGMTRRMARRFVAGEELEDALAAARACNRAGMLASPDYLGENEASEADPRRARGAYLNALASIESEYNALTVSLNPS